MLEKCIENIKYWYIFVWVYNLLWEVSFAMMYNIITKNSLCFVICLIIILIPFLTFTLAYDNFQYIVAIFHSRTYSIQSWIWI